MIFLMTILALMTGFIIHVIWWRLAMPKNSTLALLTVFSANLCMFILRMHDTAFIIPFVLLYWGCALVYIIMYSAIEQQSPTLAIVGLIHAAGEDGCSIQSLKDQLQPDAQIQKRLQLIAMSGMIAEQDDRWELTNKGKSWAGIFALSSIIFGLQRGG